jgi:hypothetical protein
VATPDPQVYDDLSNLVLPSDRYTVLSAPQSMMDVGASDLVDSVEITFMVTGRPGIFTVELPIVGFQVFESGLDLTSEADIIDALYSL